MIISLIMDLFKALIKLIISLIPTMPDLSGFVVGLEPFLNVVKTANLVVSLPVVSGCLLVLLVVYNIKFIFSFLMWIVRKIPGMS